MKPCHKNRKQIAWLAADALEAANARRLRAHLETCAGCRQHLEEMSSVKWKLEAAELAPDFQTSERFHRRVVRAVAREGSPARWGSTVSFLRAARLNWRVALPVAGALALALGFAFSLGRHPGQPSPVPPMAASPPVSNETLAPTLANYDRVADESIDRLDDLLNRQARRRLAPARVYTASALFLGSLVE